MPGGASEDHGNPKHAGGVAVPKNGASSFEVGQFSGALPLPEDLVGIISPLLLALGQVSRADVVAAVLPVDLAVGSGDEAEVAVLCAIKLNERRAQWGEAVTAAAAGIRRDVASQGDKIPVAIEAPGAGLLRGTAWPIPLDGEEGPGLLMSVRTEGAEISRDSSRMAESIAQSLSHSLRSIQRHRRRERGSTALLEVARTAGSTLQLEEVLSLVTERAARLVGADRCGLWLLAKDGNTLVPSALYGMSSDYLPTWKAFRTTLDAEPLSKEAIESGRPALVSDATTDPRTDKAAVHFFGDKTILVLPLLAKGQVQGSLFINHVKSYHRYTAGEIETAMAIANQAAISVQNAKLYRQVEEWSSQLERLQAIMSKLSRSRTVSSIASIITDELRNLIRYDTCRVWALSEDANELVPIATLSSTQEYLVDSQKLENLRIEVGQGITGHVAATGVPTIVGDVERDSQSYHVPDTMVLDESMIATPINFEGRVIGVITLSRLGLNQFGEDDLRLLGVFANEAAIEFENARLHQETQRKSRELLSSFHRVGDALAAGLDLGKTLQIIVELAAEMVRAKACVILLVDEADGELLFRASKGLRVKIGESGHVHAGRGLNWEVVQEGRPKVVPDLSAMEQPEWIGESESEKLCSYLGVPLVLQGRVIGVLAVFGSRIGQFNQSDVELLSSFTHQAAIAIRNAQLFTSLQKRVEELTGLAEVSRITTILTRLDDTFRELTRSIANLLQSDRCVLLLAENGGELIPQQPAYGLTPDEASRFKLRILDSASASEESYSCLELVDGTVMSCEGECQLGPYLLAPMRAQDKLIGMVLVSGRPEPGFTEDDIRLLTILSANAAVIVQNATLYQSVDREREELDAIISNTSDAIIIVDQECRVVRMNAAAESLTGWSAEEVVGQPCMETMLSSIAVDSNRIQSGTPLADVLRETKPVPYFETVLVTKDGAARDVAASYSYVESAGRGEALGVVIGRDISQQREVDRMKSEFVSMVSHELRTPLGLIKGYASTLVNPQMKVDEQTAQRFLMGIDSAADRLARLIENVLSVSRIEAGQLKISPQPVDLVRVVTSSAESARATAKGHEILLELPEGPVMVEGDRIQLELALDNLITNAIKYSPMGKPVHVELDKLASEAQVRVIDEGIGIAAHHLAKVFDRFYRVEGGYTRKTPGSGLGLYICKNIVEAHGGRVWGKSKLGEGSVFTIAIPLAKHERDQSPGSFEGES